MKQSTCSLNLLIAFLMLLPFFSSAQTCEVYREDFNGSTTFVEKLLPYGTPAACTFAAAATFENNGTEQHMTVYSYFEACLRKTGLNLPAGDYIIKMKYRIGSNAEERPNACALTNFDDRWGAACFVPNRVIAVNDKMIYETPGNHANENKTVWIPYSGKIDSIDLAMVGNCSITAYEIFFDYLVIIDQNALPQINFGYAASGGTVTFTDSTVNGGTNAPLWDFGDGNTSTDANPVYTYAADSTYIVCLTRSNACGPNTACKEVTVVTDTTANSISAMHTASLAVYPDQASKQLMIHFPPSAKRTIIQLYSGSGKLERELYAEAASDQVRMNTSGLAPGIYVIRTMGEKLFMQKVVLY